ncbi:MAG: hypothetical protein KKF44_03510 [Nanoarchaeota archaeon]|nr:hypothetical protein [Nanoarchaeota archaeon]
MKTHKLTTLALFFLVITAISAFGVDVPSIFINSLATGKDDYTGGERADILVTVQNSESYPILGGYLVVDLVFVDAANENIVREKVFRDINLLPGESKNLKYDFFIPDYLRQGGYRFDVYFKSERTDYVGHPFILSGAKSTDLKISNNPFRDVRIVREKTLVCGKNMYNDYAEECIMGVYGPIVSPGGTARTQVGVKNYGSEQRNLVLIYGVYEWDDTEEPYVLWEILPEDQTLAMDKGNFIGYIREDFILTGFEEKMIELDIPVPKKAGAYALRIEVFDERTFNSEKVKDSDDTYSLYRGRMVVEGPAARIRELYPAGVDLSQDGRVTVVVSGSPDGLSEFEGNLQISISGETPNVLKKFSDGVFWQNNVFEKTYDFPEVGKVATDEFTITAEVYDKSGKLVDKFSVKVLPELFIDRAKPAENQFSIVITNEQNPDAKETEKTLVLDESIIIKAEVLDSKGNAVKDSKVNVRVVQLETGEEAGVYDFYDTLKIDDVIEPGTYKFIFSSNGMEAEKVVELKKAEAVQKSNFVMLLYILIIIVMIVVLFYSLKPKKKEPKPSEKRSMPEKSSVSVASAEKPAVKPADQMPKPKQAKKKASKKKAKSTKSKSKKK